MALWMVRAGKQGEREEFDLENNVVAIGWQEIGRDLSTVKSKQEMAAIIRGAFQHEKDHTLRNWLGQLWAFVNVLKPGDLVALPLKRQATVAIGEVTGPYQYRLEHPVDARHVRTVTWLRKDIFRTSLDQDLQQSLNAVKTVCQIRRDQAERRVRAILGVESPRPGSTSAGKGADDATTDIDAPLDLEQYARDQIVERIGQKFRGHKLADLVTGVLRAQGYETLTSRPGPDGGVDIFAGAGPLGFDAPRLLVQVKSSDQQVGVGPVRELEGVMGRSKAQQGLLVSWGGFSSSVAKDEGNLFFSVRLWGQSELVDAIMANYERLTDDIQAELPLKRIWTLVPEG